MENMHDIVKLAVDAYHNNVQKYSQDQSLDVLRQALIEANGGKTALDYKMVRDGKCAGLFALVEEILSRTVVEGLENDDFFNAFVDFRNVALGDQNLFVCEDSNLYVVHEAAEGTQGIRRQRLGGTTEATIPTTLKLVRIYEELNRVLAGRVDFNVLINKVAESFRKQLLDDIYTVWSGATSEQLGGVAYFPEAGEYDEDELLDLIAHVEAAAGGKTATLIGTKKALRNLRESIQGNGAKEEIHNMGYYGRFYGSPVMAIPQRHKINSTDFVMNDDIITIVAGDDRPIKVVREGDPIVLLGDPMTNADFTQEYLYGERYGIGLILAGGNAGIGRYEMTAPDGE